MSQKPACIQCGGTDYVLESGFYFCSECQVQSQDIREEVFDDYWQGQKTGRVSIAAPLSQEVATQDSLLQESIATDKNLTSWEVFNIILKGLVDELTLLGAPKELKLVVLQLWASYLMKTEAAFISKLIEKRPRLDLNFRKRDAELIYGTNKELINAYKKPIYRKKITKSRMPNEKESSFANTRMKKYRLTKKTKMLAKAEYEQSSVSSQASEITLESLSAKSVSSSSQKSYKLRYNTKAKVALSSMLDAASEIDNDARSSLQKQIFGREAKSLHHLSLSKLLAILRLALLILDSDIHLGDLLRWSAEGYLSLLNAEKLLPSKVSIGKDIIPIFIFALNSREHINRKVMLMADSLGVVDVSPRILPLIERYLKELQLPDDLLKIIRMLMELSPPRLRLTLSVNYEGRAMAFIIFALKLLLGLDGTTEKCISKVTKIINRKQEKDKKRLFNWSEWVSYINCRSSVVSVYHQATRNIYHPASAVGGSKPFLSHWEKLPSKHTFERKHIIPSSVKECMSRFVKDLCQEPVEPLPPSLSPLCSNLMEIFDRDLHIPLRTKKILEQEFTNDTVEYLYDEVWQKEISEKFNISFEQVLTAKVVQVKPVVTGSKSTRPSLKGNKEMVDVKIDYKEGKSGKRKRYNPQLDMKRSFLPNPDDFLHGVKLKDRSESFKEVNIVETIFIYVSLMLNEAIISKSVKLTAYKKTNSIADSHLSV
ncbi:unnamed protein product [Nezara viridula]|uniref:Rrn7/TAF1B C-terminal cyclin domain-containing protein n=1 Tax=Nezara viridula TaxID=85310 RepID=A0A9P0H6I3_NEZVI|nr:unnamed protein product [Nezara viridula]